MTSSPSPASAPAPAPTRPSRRTVLLASAPAAASVVGLTALTAPRPSRLGEPTGDADLASALEPQLDGHRRVAAAVIDDGRARFVGFGADETAEFEIGSVSKAFTGALLAVAVERGEAEVGTTVADVLGSRADGSAIADVTFAELATHTSGLPRLPSSKPVRGLLASLLRKDPYRGRDAEQVIDDALGCEIEGRGTFSYSNLGVALEGQLLVRAASAAHAAHADGAGSPGPSGSSGSADYADLLDERILRPLGMADSFAPIVAEGLRETAVRGRTASGLPSAPWTFDGSAPAGGIRSTAADLARFLAGMIDGSAPGASAATEILFQDDDGSAVSMNWFHDDLGTGDLMTWHNGMTGGFASFVGWDPGTGRGIVLLSDTARSLDEVGAGVLTGRWAL